MFHIEMILLIRGWLNISIISQKTNIWSICLSESQKDPITLVISASTWKYKITQSWSELEAVTSPLKNLWNYNTLQLQHQACPRNRGIPFESLTACQIVDLTLVRNLHVLQMTRGKRNHLPLLVFQTPRAVDTVTQPHSIVIREQWPSRKSRSVKIMHLQHLYQLLIIRNKKNVILAKERSIEANWSGQQNRWRTIHCISRKSSQDIHSITAISSNEEQVQCQEDQWCRARQGLWHKLACSTEIKRMKAHPQSKLQVNGVQHRWTKISE